MKQVIVLQGLPGSGKSTFARQLNGLIASADHTFETPTGYQFDPSRIGEAHNNCFRAVIEALQRGEPLVIVDNTNTSVAEMAPYMLAAGAYGYEAKVLRVLCSVETALERNVHGVPEPAIRAMAEALETVELPPWWMLETVKAGRL
jgi:predicted kinase